MEGFAPGLPFVVARVGGKAYLDACILHLFYNVAGVADAWILLAAGDEEHIEILVKALYIG